MIQTSFLPTDNSSPSEDSNFSMQPVQPKQDILRLLEETFFDDPEASPTTESDFPSIIEENVPRIVDMETRQQALEELAKVSIIPSYDAYLAPALWYSLGTMAALVSEIVNTVQIISPLSYNSQSQQQQQQQQQQKQQQQFNQQFNQQSSSSSSSSSTPQSQIISLSV